MTSRPKIFLTRRLPPQTMERLQVEAEVFHVDLDRPPTREELLHGVRDVDGLLCLLTDRVDAELLDVNPALKVVSNYAVGYNNIDVEAATSRNIAVTNTPGVLTDCTADMAWTLLMAAARRLVEGDQLVRSSQWDGWGPLQLLGTEVTGATIGFVGFGRIAKAVAKRARAFDMRMLYWNRTRMSRQDEDAHGVEYRSLNELLPECDFVSIHVALCKETQHLISTSELALMKPTATLVNTARGAVVDEKALVEALRSGQIARAGLDVYEREPLVEDALRSMSNVVLAPHLGSATIETRTRMGAIAVENCLAACGGKCPPNLVNQDWHAPS